VSFSLQGIAEERESDASASHSSGEQEEDWFETNQHQHHHHHHHQRKNKKKKADIYNDDIEDLELSSGQRIELEIPQKEKPKLETAPK